MVGLADRQEPAAAGSRRRRAYGPAWPAGGRVAFCDARNHSRVRLERLREHGELRAARLAHAAFFLSLVESAMPKLLGSEQATWLRRLESEHDNVRAALGWLTGGGPEDVEMALHICCFAALFWDIHGHLFEGRRWLSN